MSRRHISWKKDGDSNQCFCIRLTAYGSSTQTQRAILASGDVIYMHGQSFFFFKWHIEVFIVFNLFFHTN